MIRNRHCQTEDDSPGLNIYQRHPTLGTSVKTRAAAGAQIPINDILQDFIFRIGGDLALRIGTAQPAARQRLMKRLELWAEGTCRARRRFRQFLDTGSHELLHPLDEGDFVRR